MYDLTKKSAPPLKLSWVTFSWALLSFLRDTSCKVNLVDKHDGWVLKIAPPLTVIVFLLQLEINQFFVQLKTW